MRSVEELVFKARMEGVSEATKAMGDLGRAFAELGQKSTGDVNAAGLERLASTTGALSNQLLGLGGAGAAALGVLGKAAMDAESRMSRLKTAFRGNGEQARAASVWLEKYADSTPFKTSDIVQAGTAIRATGLDMQKWTGIAAKMAAANPGKSISDAAEAIKDAKTGEMERLKEFMVTPGDLAAYGGPGQGGATNAEANMKALALFVEDRFGTALSDAMQTTAGQISTTMSKIEKAGAGLGRFLLPEINKTLASVTRLTDGLAGLDEQTQREIVGVLKWGTVVALAGAGVLKAASIVATLKIAMMGSQVAQAKQIALQKAETAAVREGVVAYNEKAEAYLASAAAGSRAGTAGAASAVRGGGGGLWSRGGLLRMGGGLLGLGMVAGGLYWGMRDSQLAERERQQGLWHNPAGVIGGALLTSGGAMLAVKSLLNTDLKTTLIVGVAAGILYGFSRLAGRYNERFSPEGIKDTITAAISGGYPSGNIDKGMLARLKEYFGGRAAGLADAAVGAFDVAAKGRRLYQDPYGNIVRRDPTYTQSAYDVNAIMGQVAHHNTSGLMGYLTEQVPQSGRLSAMQAQYGRLQASASASIGQLASQAAMAVGMAEGAKRIELRTGRKPMEDYYKIADDAMNVLEDNVRTFAEGLRDAAIAIREARIDNIDDDLKGIGDMLSAVEGELLPESMRAGLRARRDQLVAGRVGEMQAMGLDRDARAYMMQAELTRRREARSDQQDAIDTVRDVLQNYMGEFDVYRDYGKLTRSQQAAMQGAAPEWFGRGAHAAPTKEEILDVAGDAYDAMMQAGQTKEARQLSLDMVRWQMGLLGGKDKRSPNIAREILSTGGVSGLAEASISQIVSGGYLGVRRQGVFGPYRLSGAAASRVRASVSQENEKHVRIDMYLHPDAGAMDDLANAATTQVIQTLPKAFRGGAMTLQMQP